MNDHDFNKLQRTFIVAVAAYNVDSHEASYEVLLDKQLTQQKPQLKSLLNWNDSFKYAKTLWWTEVSSWVQIKWQF